jgi:hypothetical protein
LAGSIMPPLPKRRLDMRPRTVIIFGNPKAGTPPMTKRCYTGNRPADEGPRLAGRSGQGLAHLQYQ